MVPYHCVPTKLFQKLATMREAREGYSVLIIITQLISTLLSIGVGRCSDLGGTTFFKQLKDNFLLLVDTDEEQCLILQ